MKYHDEYTEHLRRSQLSPSARYAEDRAKAQKEKIVTVMTVVGSILMGLLLSYINVTYMM